MGLLLAMMMTSSSWIDRILISEARFSPIVWRLTQPRALAQAPVDGGDFTARQDIDASEREMVDDQSEVEMVNRRGHAPGRDPDTGFSDWGTSRRCSAWAARWSTAVLCGIVRRCRPPW